MLGSKNHYSKVWQYLLHFPLWTSSVRYPSAGPPQEMDTQCIDMIRGWLVSWVSSYVKGRRTYRWEKKKLWSSCSERRWSQLKVEHKNSSCFFLSPPRPDKVLDGLCAFPSQFLYLKGYSPHVPRWKIPKIRSFSLCVGCWIKPHHQPWLSASSILFKLTTHRHNGRAKTRTCLSRKQDEKQQKNAKISSAK